MVTCLPVCPVEQAPKPPDWPPEKTYAALKKQLADLDRFRGRNYREAQNEEQGWMNLTDKIIEHGFGEDSSTGSQFNHAKWAGQHRINMSEGEIQRNFGLRIEAFDAMLKSSIAELELIMEPKPASSRAPTVVVPDSRQVFFSSRA